MNHGLDCTHVEPAQATTTAAPMPNAAPPAAATNPFQWRLKKLTRGV